MKSKSNPFLASLRSATVAFSVVLSFAGALQDARAGTNWTGTTNTDWNTAGNWGGAMYATGNGLTINTSTGNIATITANPTINPGDVFVGQTGTTGRLDIRAGLLRNNVIGTSGNWNFIGTGGTTANGTVNIANTAVTGQSNLTTFGQGSGSFTGGKFWIGGRDGATGGTGVLNINTTGSILAQSTDNFGTIAGDTSQAAGIIIGTGATGNGTVRMDSGTVTSTSAIWVGNIGGTGLWNQSGGSTTTSALTIARRAGTGTVTVNGGTFSATGFTGTGHTGADINGGDVSFIISRGASASSTQQGTLNVGGTGIVSSVNDFLIGFAGAATSFGAVNVNSGGILNIGTGAEKWLVVNRFDAVQGKLTVDGGALNLQNNSDIQFSQGGGIGTSFVTVKNGGAINGGASSIINLSLGGGTNAVNNTVNLEGGTSAGVLTIGQIISTGTGGTRVVNFNGGTLKAAAASTSFFAAGVASAATVTGTSSTIDNDGFAIGIGQVLSGTGGLKFAGSGAGATTLTSVNLYSGATNVNSGTLLVNGSLAAASTVNVASVAFLGGGVGGTAGTINGSVISSGGTIVPGSASTVGTLAIGGNLTLTGGIISLNLSGTSNTQGGANNDLITVGGNVTADGVVLVSPVFSGGAPANGTSYTFGTYVGTLGGSGSFAAASRAINVDTSTANQLKLTYTGASFGNLKWNSNSSGAWDILTSQNWLNSGTSNQDYFYDADVVTFDDTSGVQTGITIANPVAPGSVTVNSNTNNFTFSGINGISGVGTLTKSGSSTLTLNNANSYSGGTTLNAGTLNLGNASAIGSGALTITGGTIDNSSGGALNLAGNNAQNWNGSFAFGGSNALNLGTGAVTLGTTPTVTVNGSGALTVGGAIGGAFGITKTGSGTLTLGGTSTFTGDLTIDGGIVTAATGQGATPNASNLGALQPVANRNITINNGGTLFLTGGNVLGTGGSTNTLSNTTLVVNSGGVFQTGLNGAVTGSGQGWWNKVGALNLNGGIVRVGSGANNANFQGLALLGTVTVGGSTASSIENFGASTAAYNGVHLGQNAGAGQQITFNVADVTGDQASDLNVSAKLLNTSANLTGSGLIKTGLGTITLSGANAYTGTTSINAGTVSISADNNLGASAATVTLNGGTLKTTGGLDNTHAITVGASGGTINIATTGQLFMNIANTLLGSGTLNLTGSGILPAGTGNFGNFRIGQANTFNGAINVSSGGSFEYGVAGAVDAAATFDIGNEAEFALQGDAPTSASNAITVSGGTNSVLSFENGNGGNYSGSITLNQNATFGLRDWYNHAASHGGTVSGVISGSGGITTDRGTSTGTPTLTLSGVNTYTGNTTISEGITLAITGAGKLGGGTYAGNISNAGNFNYASSSAQAISGVISGIGALNQSGSGTLTLTGNNTFTGATTVSAGKLVVNGSLASTTTSVASGATLGGTGSLAGTTTVQSGGIHGPGNSPGVQSFTNLTYNDGSIFSWEIDRSATQTRGLGYDGVNVTGTLAGQDGIDDSAIFRVVVGDSNFSDTFWTSAHTWADIFTTNGTDPVANWASIFGGGVQTYTSSGTLITDTAAYGSFTLTGSSLSWSAVPETGNAVAGLLIGAGLLRRRRR